MPNAGDRAGILGAEERKKTAKERGYSACRELFPRNLLSAVRRGGKQKGEKLT